MVVKDTRFCLGVGLNLFGEALRRQNPNGNLIMRLSICIKTEIY